MKPHRFYGNAVIQLLDGLVRTLWNKEIAQQVYLHSRTIISGLAVVFFKPSEEINLTDY